ncbi:MAG: Uma2 family endonuclease, partial [Cyanobacteria bacterium P01_H01_bin.121]
WQEIVAPLIVIEFVSGNGAEERDATSPLIEASTNGGGQASTKVGKFWVYEQAIRVPFYAIYEVDKAAVEVYELLGNRYQRCEPNQRGHFPIEPLGVELGIWEGTYLNQPLPWLRWWDSDGQLLLCGDERAEQEKQRTEQEKQRADRLAAKLRELGVDPDSIP